MDEREAEVFRRLRGEPTPANFAAYRRAAGFPNDGTARGRGAEKTSERSDEMGSYLPRTDVASGGLAGALTVVLTVLLGGQGFDQAAFSGAVAALIVFAGGYVARRYKPAVAAAAVPVGVLVGYVVGVAFFDAPKDEALLASTISALIVALVTYLAPPHLAGPKDVGADRTRP